MEKTKKKSLYKYINIFTLLISFTLLFVSCNNSEKQLQPVIENGVIDLRGWNFEKDGNIALNGKWKFYWKELVDPTDTIEKSLSDERFMTVPGFWENTEAYSAKGFATYSLVVLLDSTDQWLKFFARSLRYFKFSSISFLLILSLSFMGFLVLSFIIFLLRNTDILYH